MTAFLKEVGRDRATAMNPVAAAPDKDRFDALLRLRDTWQKKWDARVANEWRISFGVWTILALGIAQKFEHHSIFWLLPVAVISAHAYILLGIRKKNTQDGKICLYYLREAERIYLPDSILPNPTERKAPSPSETWLHPAFIAQMTASLVLCIALLAL